MNELKITQRAIELFRQADSLALKYCSENGQKITTPEEQLRLANYHRALHEELQIPYVDAASPLFVDEYSDYLALHEMQQIRIQLLEVSGSDRH